MAKVTCRTFAASGHDNMAAMIMWLRGYHAGRTGIVAATDTSEAHTYGGRLGHYCTQHPDGNVIDASEQILSDEDHGI
jgi:HdeA/HdeB family